MGFQLTEGFFTDVDVDFFGKCQNNKALLGWRSGLEPLESRLRKRNAKAKVYLGKEFIYSRRVGWRLNRYGSVKVLKSMWSIVESGVYSKLLNISYRPPAGKHFEPRPLTIHGNIIVQFVFYSGGLSLALLILVAESRKKIASWFHSSSFGVKLRFLIRNFLNQSQGAFLQGLRLLRRRERGTILVLAVNAT